jgi:hypothetical protein
MIEFLTGLQQLLVAAAIVVGGMLFGWRLLARVTHRVPSGANEPDPDLEQALAQIDAHLGYSLDARHPAWDGTKRLETGDTHVGF